MSPDYNMLVTFHENERGRAETEIAERLSNIGKVLEDMVGSSAQGVLLVRVGDDPKETVMLLKGLALKYPELFKYTHRYVPIEKWVKANEKDMVQTMKELASRIGEDERWKMELQKRHWKGSTHELIILLADQIDKGKVDLERPELTIMVEIIEETVGFALLTNDEMLDINRIREQLGLIKIY